MRRPLLFLILVGLLAAGVYLLMLAADPPTGNDEPPTTATGQGRPQTGVAPMSADDRTDIGDAPVSRPGRPAVPTLLSPITITVQLREKVNREPIPRVNYTVLGPGGRRGVADRAEVPVRMRVATLGEHIVVFKWPGFSPRELKIDVTTSTRDHYLDVDMRREQGRARIEVRDRVSNQPMAGFQVWSRTGNRGLWSLPTKETHYDLLLDLDTTSHLKVEAPGYVPSEERVVKVTALEPEAEVVFLLERAMPFTGIELRVFEATLSPAKKVRVVAEIKRPNDTWREIWNRQASRENGVYQLPNLKSGTYRLTVRTVPPEGQLDMHVPFVKEIEFTGGEKYELPVQLVEGARILLKVTDHDGKVLGRDVGVRLTTAAGEVVRSLWEHIDDKGKPLPFVAIGANGLVQDSRARLFDPVPPGQYRLQVERGGRRSQVVPITLKAGETKAVRIKI